MELVDRIKSDARRNDAASSSRRRKQGIIVSYIYTGVQVIVNFIYVPLLLSTIGQDEYGLYQIVGAIMTYVVSINSILSAGVGRYYSMYKAEGDERMMESTLAIAKRLYWGLSAVALAVVGAVIPIFRATYADSFSAGQLDECSVMLAVMAVNTVVTFNNSVNVAAINANERFVFLKVVSMMTLAAQPVLVALVARLYPSAVVVSLVVLSMNILSSTLQRVFAQGFLSIKYTFRGWDRRLVRGLLGFSVAIIMTAVADQIFWTSSNLVIAYFYGAGPVAIYAVGSQVYKAYMSAGTGIAGVFFQRVSVLYHYDQNMAAISALFTKVGRITFLACSLVLGGFVVLGQDFIYVWAGEGYEASFWVAVAVMAPMTVDLIQNLGLTIMQVENRYHFRGIVYITLAVINIALSILLVPRFGTVGAAVTSGLCMFVGNGLVMNWYYSRRVGLDIGLFWREIAGLGVPFLVATTIADAAYWLFPIGHGEMPLLLAGGILYIILYVVIVGRWGLNEYEREQVNRLVTRLRHPKKGFTA